MCKEFAAVLSRNMATLVQDAVGAGALVVMLLVGLNLPIHS